MFGVGVGGKVVCGQEAEAWGSELETGLGSKVLDAQLRVPTAASLLWPLGRQLFSFGL